MGARLVRHLWVWLATVALLLVARGASAYSGGITSDAWGYTGAAGCANAGCHAGGTAPTLSSFAGPFGSTASTNATIQATSGVAGQYTLTALLPASAAGAGINVTAFSGTLATCGSGGSCTGLQAPATSLFSGGALTYTPQITHTSRHNKDASGLVSFSFNYTPSSTACQADIYVWVNAVNGNGSTTGDAPSLFVYHVNSNGRSCNDGNACTNGDVCSNGGCAGTAVTCAALDGCHQAGSCNPATGLCSNPAANNGTPCTDNNACTVGDTCQAGVCAAGAAVTCALPPTCHTAAGAACVPATGLCNYPGLVANGTVCSDGNACTSNDVCTAGTCAGAGIQCTNPPPCHTAVGATCSLPGGVCNYPLAADGTACDDGNACTTGDQCNAGTCRSGAAVTCGSPPACHTAAGATCDKTTGACSYPAARDGTVCDDGDACTTLDSCAGGSCVGDKPIICDAPGTCHTTAGATCDKTTGSCSYPVAGDGAPCDDGDACTQTDTCTSGVCNGANPVACPPPVTCHEQGVCDPTTGLCSDPLAGDGSACSDLNACTTMDACLAGSCDGESPIACPAPDQCHDQGACDKSSGLCDNPAKVDGAPCDDHDLCTVGDACKSGTCAPGTKTTCPALDDCHEAGACNPADGTCSTPKKADGAACGDHGTCSNGACTGMTGSGGSGGGTGGGDTGGSGGIASGGGDTGGQATNGSTGTGTGTGNGVGGAGGGQGGAPVDAGGGCGCRVGGGEPVGSLEALATLLAVSLVVARRRRRAPTDREADPAPRRLNRGAAFEI